ncbi:tyrosine-type recombinase/integrase [Cupriavidus neocaledonicus]|uniref:Integrase n=2 Tax=Cupriavidus neocaledonicus TaxID=1040979 RepID=A0A375H3N5_9BURK|nr:integrase arm-type DNA-binding domain-containing protein [Cupriavidus neocaledonicus]SOZ37718.1 Integrase [Cupriavidus neocaledonicus]SPD46292.1 Integrase [Cupriavidus neocaledonicus]
MADNIARSLTDALVRNAKPADKPYKMTDGGGLYLLVQSNGAKLWRYKFRLHGREGLHSIGAYPDVSLSAARNEHRTARAMVAAGDNPVHTRQAERAKAVQDRLRESAGAFETVLQGWRSATEAKLAPVTIKQRKNEITKYLVPEFRQKTIDAIRRQEIAAFLKRIDAKTPEVAKNLRTYLSGIFEYAIDVGLVEGNPVPPSRVLTRRAQTPHVAMAEGKIGGFLDALGRCTANPETIAAVRLVVLTACRKAEITSGRWSEIDLDAAEWVIPAERMKARRQHWVPLSTQAVAILRRLREISNGNDLIFPNRLDSTRPMAERSTNALLERIGYRGETMHGWRAVFSTHFNELGANADVIERCLAHAPADKVRAAYNRHEYKPERRTMLQDWANWIDEIVDKYQKQHTMDISGI